MPAAVPKGALAVVWTAALLSLCALLVAGRAEGAGSSADAYLAPGRACSGADDVAAPAAVQAGAIVCLVNRARSRDGLRVLTSRRVLARAAALKGRAIASCGELSHAPCGTEPAAQVRKTGYRFTRFGENIYTGPWGRVSARQVVRAWLESPAHRANLLRPAYRELGVAPARADDILGNGESVLWTAVFATPA